MSFISSEMVPHPVLGAGHWCRDHGVQQSWSWRVLELEGAPTEGQNQRSIYCISCVGIGVCFVGHQ